MDFPINGPRGPVYSFMRSHGFVMSNWSDKIWSRADGMQASIYGSGSMLLLSKDGNLIADDTIQNAMEYAKLETEHKP